MATLELAAEQKEPKVLCLVDAAVTISRIKGEKEPRDSRMMTMSAAAAAAFATPSEMFFRSRFRPSLQGLRMTFYTRFRFKNFYPVLFCVMLSVF
jgi:hypothetical protein